MQAVILLEEVQQSRRVSSGLRLAAAGLYSILGAPLLVHKELAHLEIKHIQHDTLSGLLLQSYQDANSLVLPDQLYLSFLTQAHVTASEASQGCGFQVCMKENSNRPPEEALAEIRCLMSRVWLYRSLSAASPSVRAVFS